MATAILLESNGGQAKGEATQPEVRLAVAEPGLDIGNVETALEALTEASYHLTVERNRHRFSLKENLNKRCADRRATIQPASAQERIREEIQKVFTAGSGVERVFFGCRQSGCRQSNGNCRAFGSHRLLTPSPSSRSGRFTSRSRPNNQHPNRYTSRASVRGSSTVICRDSVVKSP